VTDIQLTNGATFLEVDGQWKMAGSTGNAMQPERHKLDFEVIKFTPIESLNVALMKDSAKGLEVVASERTDCKYDRV
jgi:hypothetical protein